MILSYNVLQVPIHIVAASVAPAHVRSLPKAAIASKQGVWLLTTCTKAKAKNAIMIRFIVAPIRYDSYWNTRLELLTDYGKVEPLRRYIRS